MMSSDTHTPHHLDNADVRLILSALVHSCRRELDIVSTTPLPYESWKSRREYQIRMRYAIALMWRYWHLAQRIAASHKLGPYTRFFQLLSDTDDG